MESWAGRLSAITVRSSAARGATYGSGAQRRTLDLSGLTSSAADTASAAARAGTAQARGPTSAFDAVELGQHL